MPAIPNNINLLGQEDLGHTPVGRIVSWAVTYGRYIMIGTEIAVLLAFISRFSLDRKLTDLKEEIAQKQAILEANRELEQDIRDLQSQLAKIKTLVQAQPRTTDLLTFVHSSLPPDVYLESLEIGKDKMTVAAIAGTTEGFSQFMANVAGDKRIVKIDMGDVKKNPLTGIHFQFVASLGSIKAK